MSLLSHSPSSLNGPGEQEKCLRTEGKPVSLQSSKRARRRTQGTTGRSACKTDGTALSGCHL